MADTSLVKQSNRRLILSFIREHGPVSKKEIQNELGISWGTVSTLSNELSQEGYIVEVGRQQNNGTGLAPALWDINEKKHFVVGIDFNIKSADAVVVDLKGRSLYKQKVRFNSKKKEDVLAALYEMLDDIFRVYPTDEVVVISFSVQGLVDHDKGVSIYLEALEGWNNVPLKELMESRYQIKTLLMRDTNCILISEKNLKIGQMRNVDDAILVRLETYGIGMGILLNGECYLGGNGRAGEIGRVLIHTDCNAADAFLDRHTCEQGMVRKYCALTGESAENITMELIAQRARKQEIHACKVFSDAAKHLGSTIVNLANIYDPKSIVVFGNMRAYSDLYLDTIQEFLDCAFYGNFYQQHIQVQLSKLELNAGAKGAALHAIHEELTNV